MADSVVKTKKTRAIRQKGKAFRQQEPLLAVLQWGVNHCINELLCVPEKQLLLQQDFKAHHKININNQYYNDHELPSKFKVKEYCPLVFRDIRQRFQEDPDDYLYSLCDGPLSSRESSGRSGATFHTSHDLRLVLKTLSKDEVSQFHLTFQDYHTHIVECGGQTLLPRYLGMYRLTVQERDTYVIVMASVLSSQTDVVPRLFDLKGSTVDRSASDKEKAKPNPVYKDNDFVREGLIVPLGDKRAEFCDKLAQDVRLLEKLKLMDYSLLVAIYKRDQIEPDAKWQDDVYAVAPISEDQPYLFCVGIIDALTVYNRKKRAAHAAKTAKHGKAEFSTVNPEQYARRFIEFATSVVQQGE
eukprot:TRINITY_DN10573_c0_g1_i2.p1 TRINITY_DN10573_c0_g1~~TRINITY_DN10573_c0_g1_i2.p1  ORF type:complete len:356 (+),score=83.83 TRINITY_DN10573_c0_g1_i2:208-1275(+)